MVDMEWHSRWEQEVIREKSKTVSLYMKYRTVEAHISGGRLLYNQRQSIATTTQSPKLNTNDIPFHYERRFP